MNIISYGIELTPKQLKNALPNNSSKRNDILSFLLISPPTTLQKQWK